MHTRSKLLLAALTAALLLALGAGTATASRSFSLAGGGQAILATATEPRKLTFRFDNGVAISQNVTLHGSLHGLVGKRAESLIGVINRATFGSRAECLSSAGVACDTRVNPETLPWHLRLVSFTGTLPRITSIRIKIVGFAFQLQILETPHCLFRGDPQYTASVAADGRIESIRSDETRVPMIRIIREEFFRRCPRALIYIGEFSLTRLVAIRLH